MASSEVLLKLVPSSLPLQEYIALTKDGGIRKRVLREGKGEVLANRTYVTVLYTGKFITRKTKIKEEEEEEIFEGEIFDSTNMRNDMPVTFQIGGGQVIYGLDEAIKTMRVDEKAQVLLMRGYAYGQVGSPPFIPPNAEVMYEVEVLRFTEEPVNRQFQKLLKLKEEGNECYKKGDHKRARDIYKKALTIIEDEAMENIDLSFDTYDEETPPQTTKKLISKEFRDLFVALNSNLAASLLAEGDFKGAEGYCREALDQDPNNIKAIYRSGQALLGINDFEKAIEQVEKGLQISSDDKSLKLLRDKIVHARTQYQKKEKNIYNRMFSGSSSD